MPHANVFHLERYKQYPRAGPLFHDINFLFVTIPILYCITILCRGNTPFRINCFKGDYTISLLMIH